jgi:hypothetical protein
MKSNASLDPAVLPAYKGTFRKEMGHPKGCQCCIWGQSNIDISE